MRRNVISWLKFAALTAFTVFLTTIIFKLVRPSHRHEQHPRFPETARLVQDANLMDWHDYKKIALDEKRTGPGEQGKPATLPPDLEDLQERLYKVNGFNGALSDQISVNRSVADIRHPDCKQKKYLKDLDPASVIISFHNEHFSVLVRTCWSVINQSPASLIEEVILVDDASTKVELRDKLDRYVKKHLPKVKIIRLKRRSGLIVGRLTGAKQAVAKNLVFLDSHSEANINWLPPLLDPIARDYRTCVCPFIDVVAYDTFEYRSQDEGARGAFDWELYYKRLPLLPEDQKRPSEPFKSPVMAGGLFAISAKFFWELGGYDPGLDIWGGEQYELSFKIWQCGGQMLDTPCSRVGHIYRKFPPFANPGRGDFLSRNYKRVAEVWMDEWAEFVYRRRPHMRAIDAGDLSEQKALRQRLNCKSFKWFMEEVAFDLVETYPPIEPEDYASGEIRNVGYPNLCLDAKNRKQDQEVEVDVCGKGFERDSDKIANQPTTKAEQAFQFSWHKDLRPKNRKECLDVSQGGNEAPVTLYPCHGKQGNQLWRYDMGKQWILHGYGQRCLDMNPVSKKAFVNNCNLKLASQKWTVENLNVQAIKNWKNIKPMVQVQ